MRKNKYILFLFFYVSAFCVATFLFLKQGIGGDGMDYFNSLQFLQTKEVSVDFSPNRLLTTFGGLQMILLLTYVFGSISFAWIFLNTLFYFLICFVFYLILKSIHNDEEVALFGTLFLASSYGLIAFGLNFLMDIGGWFFYVLSMYYMVIYARSLNRLHLLYAAGAVGAGLLFKEYAVLGVIPIAFFLVYENWSYSFKSIGEILKKSIVPALITILPLICLHVYIYSAFGYTYLDWLHTNEERYGSLNRFVEYIKSFGSLLNFIGPIAMLGLYQYVRMYQKIDTRMRLFVNSVVVSFLPLFFWPGITQRVLFVAVPAIVILASFYIVQFRDSKYRYVLAVLLVLYMITNFFMDSFVLKFVSLPL